MGFKPNFTDATIEGTDVRINGISDDKETDDILDIHVTLVQGDRVAGGPMAQPNRLTSVWHVFVPVRDPENKASDLKPGQAAAFGIERRKENAATITWAQSLTIVK